MSNVTLQRESKSITPFLVERSIPRSEGQKLPGYYCVNSNVWVIDGPNGPESIIHSSEVILNLLTKTAVQLESDDERYSNASRARLLELATKTESKTERDD